MGEKQNKVYFSYVQIILEDKESITSVYCKLFMLFTPFLRACYHLFLSLLRSTESLIYVSIYDQVGLNYTICTMFQNFTRQLIKPFESLPFSCALFGMTPHQKYAVKISPQDFSSLTGSQNINMI